jgi:hypothetical protein
VAKQRELSGTLQSEDESKMKRQISNAKSKELSGHDIFAPPEDPRPRNSANGSTSQTPGKNAQVLTSKHSSSFSAQCFNLHCNGRSNLLIVLI